MAQPQEDLYSLVQIDAYLEHILFYKRTSVSVFSSSYLLQLPPRLGLWSGIEQRVNEVWLSPEEFDMGYQPRLSSIGN